MYNYSAAVIGKQKPAFFVIVYYRKILLMYKSITPTAVQGDQLSEVKNTP